MSNPIDALAAALAEIQRLGVQLSSDVVGPLLTPFVAADNAATPAARRAALERMDTARLTAYTLAYQYASACNAAIAPPLAAAIAAITKEQIMETIVVPITFGKDGSGGTDYTPVPLKAGQRLQFKFTAPPNDGSFDLYATHAGAKPAAIRKQVLTDDPNNWDINGLGTIWGGRSPQVDQRMFTTDIPGNRRARQRLTGDKVYYLNIETLGYAAAPDTDVGMIYSTANR